MSSRLSPERKLELKIREIIKNEARRIGLTVNGERVKVAGPATVVAFLERPAFMHDDPRRTVGFARWEDVEEAVRSGVLAPEKVFRCVAGAEMQFAADSIALAMEATK